LFAWTSFLFSTSHFPSRRLRMRLLFFSLPSLPPSTKPFPLFSKLTSKRYRLFEVPFSLFPASLPPSPRWRLKQGLPPLIPPPLFVVEVKLPDLLTSSKFRAPFYMVTPSRSTPHSLEARLYRFPPPPNPTHPINPSLEDKAFNLFFRHKPNISLGSSVLASPPRHSQRRSPFPSH